MSEKKKGLNTVCTHVGELEDKQHKGAVSPLYMSTSYAFDDVDVKRYPRYFNTPNQEGLCKKIAALEHAESALIFGSGMAAVSTALMAFLRTKYMGGHSDICAGAVASSAAHMERIFHLAKNFGGSLSDYTVWLLERSIKTMGLRVRAQNNNAMEMATYLNNHEDIDHVYYPGLSSHKDHQLAKKQMKGFGGMLSFELKPYLDASLFQKSLGLIKSSMSLAGVESTVLSPTQTSHALMSPEVRAQQGIKDGLIRFSVGIEEVADLVDDIEKAIAITKGEAVVS